MISFLQKLCLSVEKTFEQYTYRECERYSLFELIPIGEDCMTSDTLYLPEPQNIKLVSKHLNSRLDERLSGFIYLMFGTYVIMLYTVITIVLYFNND